MSQYEIANELAGNFYIYRPPKDGWIDPEDGTLGLIAEEDGFTLLYGFAQTIYPPQGSGNINGTVTDKVRYYEGYWYKGYPEDGTIRYLLKGFKRSIEVMKFSNASWTGNSTIVYDRDNSAIILQHNPDDIWYYRSKRGDFPFKRVANDSQVNKVEKDKTLEESDLTVEEWALGLWKAEVTKMDRQRDLSDEGSGYSQEEIEGMLKSYGEKKTFYLEITKDYLKYKFPLPVINKDGKEQKTCNDFSIQHSYTIEENEWNGYDIVAGGIRLAGISKSSSVLYLTVSDSFSIFSVQLYRVNDLGAIEEDASTKALDNSMSHIDDNKEEHAINNFIISSKRSFKIMPWVYGKWERADSSIAVYITPLYYQRIEENDNYLHGQDLRDGKKIRYKLIKEENSLLGEVLRLGDYYLDINEQRIYKIDGVGEKIYLEQSTDRDYPVAGVILLYTALCLAGLIALALSIFILYLLGKCFLIVIRFITKVIIAGIVLLKRIISVKGIIIVGCIILLIIIPIVISNKFPKDVEDKNTTITEDYSWIYGTWRLDTNGDSIILSFNSSGMYILSFYGAYGKNSETGVYDILGDRIKLTSSQDRYSSYIYIEGHSLKDSDGHYYRKR